MLWCCACLWASRQDPACDLSALSLPSPSPCSQRNPPMAVTALGTLAGWQRRGCFIPPPSRDSLTPAELSCRQQPRLCTDTIAPVRLLQPPAAIAGSHKGAPCCRAVLGVSGPQGRSAEQGRDRFPTLHSDGLIACPADAGPGTEDSLPPSAWLPTTTSPLLCRSLGPAGGTFHSKLPGAAQQACALHTLLPQFTTPQRALREQELVSCVSSASSCGVQETPNFLEIEFRQ